MNQRRSGLGARLSRLVRGRRRDAFDGSASYWESRYRDGGSSGVGSYDRFAQYKAEFINDLVARESIGSAIELGCGDGNQLALLEIERYTGVDVSETVLEACRARFADDPTRRFLHADALAGPERPRAELALSLDVIYHLVEDAVFERHIDDLFACATRRVVVYSSDDPEVEAKSGPHVRHRRFTDRIALAHPDWTLVGHEPNRYPYAGDYRSGSFAEFHVYAPRGDEAAAGGEGASSGAMP